MASNRVHGSTGEPICYDERMIALVLIGALIVVPILLGLFLRVSAVLLFASLLSGSLFVQYLGDDVALAINAATRNPQAPLYAQIAVLLLPVLLTAIFARRSMSPSKLLLNLLPLISVGLATAVLVLPLLPSGVQANIFSNPYGNILRQTQDNIIGLAVLLNLALIWISFKTAGHDKHGKRH